MTTRRLALTVIGLALFGIPAALVGAMVLQVTSVVPRPAADAGEPAQREVEAPRCLREDDCQATSTVDCCPGAGPVRATSFIELARCAMDPLVVCAPPVNGDDPGRWRALCTDRHCGLSEPCPEGRVATCTDQPECGTVFACLTPGELSVACEADNPQACDLIRARSPKASLPREFFRTERRAAARQCNRLQTEQACLHFLQAGASGALPDLQVKTIEPVMPEERRAMELVCSRTPTELLCNELRTRLAEEQRAIDACTRGDTSQCGRAHAVLLQRGDVKGAAAVWARTAALRAQCGRSLSACRALSYALLPELAEDLVLTFTWPAACAASSPKHPHHEAYCLLGRRLPNLTLEQLAGN